MSMKKMLAVVAAASLVAVAAPAFAANPFSDVPMNHWAYDAVEELASKGILEGYPNGTFKGNRAMTRYEIATMVARMMNAGLTGADLEKLKALVVEFQPELDALGVKVDGFDSRLTALEKGLNGWQLSGQFRMDYNAWDEDKPAPGGDTDDDGFDLNRFRLFLHKDMSDGVSFDARYNGGQFDRAWVTARDFFGMEGLTARIGQFYIDWDDEDGWNDNSSMFQDAHYRGVDLKYSSGMFTVEGFAASNRKGDVYTPNASDEYYGARLHFDFNEKLWLSINGLWNNVGDVNGNAYWASLGFKFMDGLELRGAYYMEDLDVKAPEIDDPKAWRVALNVDQDVLKFTSLWVEYAKLDKGYVLVNNPWAWDDEVWPNKFKGQALKDDVDVLFVKAEQKWNDKWSSFERYTKYDANKDAKEWAVGVGYQYSPNLSFELAYADYDGRFDTTGKVVDYDNNQIRFRTYLTF